MWQPCELLYTCYLLVTPREVPQLSYRLGAEHGGDINRQPTAPQLGLRPASTVDPRMEDRCRLVTNLAGIAVRRIRLGSRRVDHTVAGHQCTCRRDSGTPTRSSGSPLHAPTQTIRYDTYSFIHSYSFIANCQTAVVHKNKTKRMSKIYKSQYILRYNILTAKLQSVIREMRSGSCLL